MENPQKLGPRDLAARVFSLLLAVVAVGIFSGTFAADAVGDGQRLSPIVAKGVWAGVAMVIVGAWTLTRKPAQGWLAGVFSLWRAIVLVITGVATGFVMFVFDQGSLTNDNSDPDLLNAVLSLVIVTGAPLWLNVIKPLSEKD